MSRFWDWLEGLAGSRRTPRIADLPAESLAGIATAVLHASGRGLLFSRVLYRALELNPRQGMALHRLVENYWGPSNGQLPQGDEVLAGLLVEYALAPHSGLAAADVARFERLRLGIQFAWGFALPKKKDRAFPDWSTIERDEFDIREAEYFAYLSDRITQAGSLAGAFEEARARLGRAAQALSPDGKPTADYRSWLRGEAATLARYRA